MPTTEDAPVAEGAAPVHDAAPAPVERAAPPLPDMGFFERAARVLAAATLAALVAGFLFGGVGGRLVMRILAQTSDPALAGLKTENGNRIREFTAAGTFELIFFLTLVSAFGGAAYIALRRWLPRARRPVLFGVLAVGFPGAAVIDPGNIDFVILDPRLLSVLLFVGLFFGYGWLLATIHERIEPLWLRAALPWPGILVFAPLLILLPFFPGLVLIALITFLCWGVTQITVLRRLWHARAVDVAGRVLLAIGGGLCLALTVKRSLEILG